MNGPALPSQLSLDGLALSTPRSCPNELTSGIDNIPRSTLKFEIASEYFRLGKLMLLWAQHLQSTAKHLQAHKPPWHLRPMSEAVTLEGPEASQEMGAVREPSCGEKDFFEARHLLITIAPQQMSKTMELEATDRLLQRDSP